MSLKYFYHRGLHPKMHTPSSSQGIIDRTQLVLPDSRVAIHTPIGRVGAAPKTIEELFHERVMQITAAAHGAKIVVLWSGGIDSTAILTAFLLHGERERVVVMCNEYSVDEYPEFYANHIHGKLPTIPLDFHNPNPFLPYLGTHVFVTGNCFDEVFGDPLYEALSEIDLRMSTETLFKLPNVRASWARLVEASPVELVDVRDLLWWKNYALDYQLDQMQWCLYDERLRLEHNLFHFCDTQDWNDYAVNTPTSVKWGGSVAAHKYKDPLRRYIKQFTGDSVYEATKRKQISMRRYRTTHQRALLPAAIDETWRRCYAI